MLSLPGKVVGPLDRPPPTDEHNSLIEKRKAETQRNISERNARFFEAEADKLEGWADDLKLGLEREIKELDRQIKEARRAAVVAVRLEEKSRGRNRSRLWKRSAAKDDVLFSTRKTRWTSSAKI